MGEVPGADDRISVVVLTFNSSASIARTLRSATRLSSHICVVDSFSTDDTVAICETFGCEVVQHAFRNYADQRNWAIAHFSDLRPWQLHIDADEEMTPDLVAAIRTIDLDATPHGGFMIRRRIVFLGRVLAYGGIAVTWHCRLFRSGLGRCEDRLYDQHFVCDGTLGTIDADMLDHQENTLSEWTIRHNRWTDMEVEELSREAPEAGAGDRVQADPRGNRIERKRFYKQRYYRLPKFWRPILYFAYRYVIRLGFLDGREGLIYHVLQALWFRFLVDAKLYERSRLAERPPGA